MIPTLLLAPLLAAAAAAPRADALSVRASAAVAPCVSAAAVLFERTSGRPVAVQTAKIGAAASAQGADVVVAVAEELTRVIESGSTEPDLDVDVASIPWVLTGATRGGDLHSLATGEATVRVPAGVIARHARRSLESLPPSRVRTESSPAAFRSLKKDEVALVPLSLAGSGPVTATDVPPLYVQALGVRGTPRPDAARAFLQFLAAGPGNAAFRACGRTDAR
jgi:hypothetical protein